MSRERACSFLQLAEEELAAARQLASGLPRQAAYFVQQAAEKLARAVLESEGIAAGPTHNLGQLSALLPHGHSWRLRLATLDKHSPAATRYRYPAPGGRLAPAPTGAAIGRDVEEIAALLRHARAEFGLV